MDETKHKINHEFSKTSKSSTHILLPNSNFQKQINEENAHYSQLVNATNASTVPKLSVQYIAISLNNEQLVNSFCKQMDNSNHTSNNINKIESFESEKKCLISLPLENAMNECDSSSLKINQSITNQRLLISPTDFLTLTEEGMCHKNSAVKKDVSLCSTNIEIIRSNSNCENNFAICLDRYCESPLMLENQKESQLICDDETSCNGRNSRLSENAEDITTDELFATTFGTDQTSSLREVVTPIENENSSNAPLLPNKDISITNKNKNMEENILCESEKELSEVNEAKPVLTILDRLDADSDADVTNCSNSITSSDNSFAFISTQTSTSVSTHTSTTTVLSPLDIKLLQTGIKDSILLANLAAALPSSMTSRQIALQVIREDGTSLVLPLNTKHESNETLTIKDANNDLPVSTSLLLAEVVNQNESIRPFKCELCNSTFTRLGNYTRHKKIHSYPSKEDQRFRCEICSKSFIQRCDLARHLHIHRGTEPHRCPQCGKGYIRHSDLVTHQRFHNKEKPFSCPHCSKGFCQRGDLNRHLRSIHLQLKPILCSHCHKKFAKEETLLRHINATHRAENSSLN